MIYDGSLSRSDELLRRPQSPGFARKKCHKSIRPTQDAYVWPTVVREGVDEDLYSSTTPSNKLFDGMLIESIGHSVTLLTFDSFLVANDSCHFTV